MFIPSYKKKKKNQINNNKNEDFIHPQQTS